MYFILLMSLACTSDKAEDTGQSDLDADADGYNRLADCDDEDPLVAPGEVEDPYDGVDNDCNPETLDDDLDGDGALSSVDCDDGDDAIRPGADELCNGQDDDCDGEADEDADASDIEEVCGNGADDNCDGSANECRFEGETSANDADAWFLGQQEGNDTTISGPPADLDGDGVQDVLITMCGDIEFCSGVSRVFSGPLSGRLEAEDATATIYSAEAGVNRWQSVSGELDGEPNVDLALAWYKVLAGEPIIDVFSGPILGELSPLDSEVQLTVDASYDGDAVYPQALRVADLSNDGEDDLLVYLAYASGDAGVGALTVHFGPLTDGTASLEDADLTLSSDVVQSAFGDALALDLNGDGADDLVIGEPDAESGAGVLYVELGPPSSGSIQDADLQLVGDQAGDYSASALADAGDADGDGRSDLWSVAILSDTNGSDSGDARLFLGSVGLLQRSEAATVSGQDGLGLTAVTSDDVDGDAQPDLLVGDYCPYGYPGTVSLFYGPLSGSASVTHADASFVGASSFDCFGSFSSLYTGEVNGDGMPDLVTSAQQLDNTTGGVYFFNGLSL